MEVKVRKKNSDGIVRLETSGVIKEVLMNENFLKPKDARVLLGFKGKDSSGIVELSVKEAEVLSEELNKRLGILKGAKIMRFEK